jgi:acid phosphatase (class A)
MRARNLLRAALACSLASGLATGAAGQEAPKPKAVAAFLSPAELDASRFVPPPPAEGTRAARAEIVELHAIEAARTRGALARARFDDVAKDASIFAAAMGPGFDLKVLPATAKLMSEVRNEEKVAADLAKAHFARKRPWIVDPSFKSCSTDDAPLTSYPSGHATMGFAMAVVLADLAPDKAPALLARAVDYGDGRLVCGMHFRTDIVAGQVLGTAVAGDLLRNPRFRADRDAAQAELRAAHLIR